MKKNVIAVAGVIVLGCLVLYFAYIRQSNPASKSCKIIINSVDLERIDELVIGAEPPNLLYADTEKVIFECCDVYIYDVKNKVLTKSYDIASFMQENYSDCLVQCTSLKEGSQFLISFYKAPGKWMAAYRCSIETNSLEELTEQEYKEEFNKRFESTYLDYQDERYNRTSGKIVTISESEYVYLTFQEWKVSTINIVYVKDDKETYYSVF
ncbi:hypothetical protein [Anaeromicropila populeti]|uniref:Uncharacterized protein n=1 Tax=Anaeromicropila populeti TaxID=37658 RepID=A0A1I6HYZ1_9FIRM|nr:hypothetical protein [Anaeromicropila populeti]SFR59628.1 hypothetical protein SAMN05661086_00410 [Anaeromicropila populeti]